MNLENSKHEHNPQLEKLLKGQSTKPHSAKLKINKYYGTINTFASFVQPSSKLRNTCANNTNG